jgi:hypothetical protein
MMVWMERDVGACVVCVTVGILTGEKELQIIALFPLDQIITLAWLCRQIITVARRTGNQDYHTPLIILTSVSL